MLLSRISISKSACRIRTVEGEEVACRRNLIRRRQVAARHLHVDEQHQMDRYDTLRYVTVRYGTGMEGAKNAPAAHLGLLGNWPD